MSDLTKIEKLKLEKLLQMGGGYVLDFSNRTFEEFILESVHIDIYDEKYSHWSGSKANRLRAFWEKEGNYTVAKLLEDLLEYWEFRNVEPNQIIDASDKALIDDCQTIIERLKSSTSSEEISTFGQFKEIETFAQLSESIRNYLSQDKPELALDRLHTFITRYLRSLGKKYGFKHESNVPLHSLMGAYVKHLKQSDVSISEMSERILKSSISILESFNKVRNEQSYAHDNELLGTEESRLIVSYVSNLLKYLDSIDSSRVSLTTDTLTAFASRRDHVKLPKRFRDFPSALRTL